jgi:UDP-N-acetylmuramate dehydrogenase
MPRETMEIRQNVPLAPLTTLGVGGSARFFAEVASLNQVEAAARFAQDRNLRLFVLGGGSNLVISDRGWDGLVIKVGIDQIEQRPTGDQVVFEVGAGAEWDGFVAHSVSQGCAGVECLSGIPGSVGGTPVQNVGAYGQEVSQTIVSVETFDLADNKIRNLSAADCRFRYRTSIFNSTERGRYIILRVRYGLTPDERPALLYADLEKHFAGQQDPPTLAQTRDAVRSIRARKGMLINPGEPDSRSAGSFFKNPVLSSAQHAELLRRASETGLRVPSYPALEQQHKVSAAWLVEHSGFAKGYIKGRAAISSKHALALINRGGATASEIIALEEEIQRAVGRTWGIGLEPEPVFVGF